VTTKTKTKVLRLPRALVVSRMVSYLSAGHRTAAQIAAKMGCSFMIARARVRLVAIEWRLDEKEVRQGVRGPTATAYKVVGKRRIRVFPKTLAAKKARSRR
jgi:hypothetical protein